ncbi:hypothetical protein THRCLA_01783 [Thraustotheca clavata]|uniref:Uncharacterized protein n=1 Tax=Thraustotheca clavata TaxID=74557 RepID=A0A1W0A7I7_9STRA|nr:hypothetical protein THRCLA_01783 [Thraustotheca clavata]
MSAAPKSLLDVANAENSSLDKEPVKKSSLSTLDKEPMKKPAPTSLLDIANETKMIEKPSLLSVAKEEHASKPTLADVATAPKTLADVAPVSLADAVAATQKNTLTDVATKLRQDKTSNFQKKASVTLTQVADTIKKERDQVIHNAIEDTAKDVKREQKEQSDNVGKVLVQAAKEVAIEAQAVTRKDVAAKLTKVVTEIQNTTAPKVKEKEPEQQENEEDYSDFDDDEEEKKKKPKEKVEEDNQSECIEEVEKAIPSSSTESKSFMQAIYRGNLRRVKEMLQNDIDIHVADQHGWNGLHWAASQGHKDILELLIESGINVHVVDPIHLWSPLQLAVIRGHVSCAKLLLRKGAIATREDIYGDSAVSCAASHRGTLKSNLNHLFKKYNGH